MTRLLGDSAGGDRDARDRLIAMVYQELHTLARQHMGGERGGHTLGATALVSEVYLKLFRGDGASGANPIEPWADRGAFFAAAATAMRRILIDHARAKLTQKRGGRARATLPSFDADAVAAAETLDPAQFMALDEAISRLEQRDARAAQITRLRFFAGLDLAAVAEVVGVSERTVIRDWNVARAWLRDALAHEPERASEEGTA